MSSDYIYEPVIHIQTSAVNTLTITHDFCRRVNTTIYNSNGQEIYPVIEEIEESGQFNKVKITFYEKSALFAVGNWKAVIS